jgi:DNA polymerase III subunit beta
MKLDTPREPFLQHLQLAASFCPARSPRPIVQDVLLEVLDGEVIMAATDAEVSVRTRYRADGVTGSGRAALPALTLLSAVRALSSDALHVTDSGVLHEISGGKSLFKLHGDDPELFPSIPSVDVSRAVRVPVAAFVDLCNRTMFAAARDMGRYAFNGVLLEIDPNEITLVATDGRRLAMARMECATGVSERRSSIVPVKGLIQLQRAAADGGEELAIDLRENQVAFRLSGSEIVAQLVEGEFPDFRAVLPKDKDMPRQVELDREELARAIHRASLTAGDQGRAIELSFDKGLLCVTSRQEGLGEARSEMGVAYDGDAIGIRFNPEFLGEYLKALEEETVTFRFKDRISAGEFSSSGNARYVVMPITS